jgi:hypothetical protein
MMITGIRYVAISTPDISRLAAFYRDAIEIVEIRDEDGRSTLPTADRSAPAQLRPHDLKGRYRHGWKTTG